MSDRQWARRGMRLVLALSVVAWAFGEVFPQPPGAIRPRTLRNRVECKLERWGLIQTDPFRHIEG